MLSKGLRNSIGEALVFRASDDQGQLFTADKLHLKMVGEKSFYAFLAREGRQLFPDERFESWYCADNGRPCTSPGMLAKVLLLRMYDRCSDAEAVERAKLDLRWKVALCLDVDDDKPFAKSTLQQHRARIHAKEARGELLLDTVGVRQARYFGRVKTRLQCILAAAVANLTRVAVAVSSCLRLIACVLPASGHTEFPPQHQLWRTGPDPTGPYGPRPNLSLRRFTAELPDTMPLVGHDDDFRNDHSQETFARACELPDFPSPGRVTGPGAGNLPARSR